METLLAVPFGYTLNQVIAVRVSAKNDNGWGLPSVANTVGAVARTLPSAMIPATRGDDTTESKIQVVWVTQTVDSETGGAPILSYNMQWDQGTGNDNSWVDLVGYPTNYLSTTYTVIEGVIKDIGYRFRLRSKNIYGFGPFSPVAVIRSSDVPESPVPATTSLDDVDVLIEWVAPYDNSEAITAYDMQVLQGDGFTWMNDLVNCPYSQVTPTSCSIPMSKLRTDFNLAQGQLVVVRVRAQNIIGYGDYSETNTQGALIATEPHKMLAPYIGEDINLNQL